MSQIFITMEMETNEIYLKHVKYFFSLKQHEPIWVSAQCLADSCQ